MSVIANIYVCLLMWFPTCCLAIMGRMTSAICRDNLFHLSSFSLWHCWSTRINISNTYKTWKRLKKAFYEGMCMMDFIGDNTWWCCTSLSSMETTTSFCVSNSLPASALFEPLSTNRSCTMGCRAGMALRGKVTNHDFLSCKYSTCISLYFFLLGTIDG